MHNGKRMFGLHIHVRVEGIAPEDHLDIAMIRRQMVNPFLAKPDLAFLPAFQCGNHTQCRRFA
jgi:hypothetical protein